MEDVNELADLPRLTLVYLEMNPFSDSSTYRSKVIPQIKKLDAEYCRVPQIKKRNSMLNIVGYHLPLFFSSTRFKCIENFHYGVKKLHQKTFAKKKIT
uniref:Leucine-rich repeat-containing protein 51 n=1 Tax=Ascaris lumbricoides TaxID=6252 RepID=A0A0M3HMA2_ASCLU